MLTKYVTHENPDPEHPGWTLVRVGPELEDDPCAICGAESHAQICELDSHSHWHGLVHLVDGGLVPLCNTCHDAYKAAPRKFHRPGAGA